MVHVDGLGLLCFATLHALAPNSPWRAAVVPGDAHAGADGTRASPRAAHRKAGKSKAGKSKGATTSPSLAEHDRPKDVASTPSPGAPNAVVSGEAITADSAGNAIVARLFPRLRGLLRIRSGRAASERYQ